MKKLLFLLIFQFCLQGCKNLNNSTTSEVVVSLKKYTDSVRNREIPVAIYQPLKKKKSNNIPIVFSHGYGANKGDDYIKDYTYLLETLAEKGYFVISIQHELKSDDLLSMEEPFKITRMSNWKRGAENIEYVLNIIKSEYSHLSFNHLALIGHSNGGDMSVLFAHQNPKLIHKLISMDNRRMDLPKSSQPKVYTIRSSDVPADKGVLPEAKEMKRHGITVVYSAIKHGDMDNDANEKEQKYLTTTILKYLDEK